jgi:lysophospholipase L1-like esterase
MRLCGVALLALTIGLLASGGERAVADPEITGYPNSIAVLGDSISQATNSEAFGNNPENSWATGTNPSVNSVYSRILAVHPGIAGNRFNDSVSGARMTHLNGQAANAVAQDAELVLILMGANDVCTSSEATMTPVLTFQAQFEAAMATLSAGLPDARIGVASIPDIHNLWAILHDDPSAQAVWAFANICQSLLANPTSMAPADVQRRANVRQRNIDFNTVLGNVCAQYIHCRFDNNAGFNAVFTPAHMSTIDYFHPNVAGEALAASVAWSSSPDFTEVTAPVSDAVGTALGGNVNVTLSATDNVGVSGIEYRLNSGAYQRYTAPLVLSTGTNVEWRAVDVNGNSEATHTCLIVGWSFPAGDGDCDAFTTANENQVGTDPNSACAANSAPNNEPLPDRWPLDFNDSQTANTIDVGFFVSRLGTSAPEPPYDVRFDLNANGIINTIDVGRFVPFLNRSCVP